MSERNQGEISGHDDKGVPITKSGEPDKRTKAGREAAEAGESSGTSKSEPKDDSKDVGDDSDIPLKKDGTPDMRYKAAKEAVADE